MSKENNIIIELLNPQWNSGGALSHIFMTECVQPTI